MSLVLVAEDSASIRLLLRRRLERAGHEVFEARDGDEAVEAVVGELSLEPDLILLDAMMPKLAGTEALNILKGRAPEIPVLMVSALSGAGFSDEWSLADGYLDKPIDFVELLNRIDLLTGGQPQPGSPSP
jgi:DNA-binding response OmpR family regulator